MHPSIAAPAAGAILRGAGPMFQYVDYAWNHGEGFVLNNNNEQDVGGWFNLDDGAGVEPGDVHHISEIFPGHPAAAPPWQTHQWNSPFPPWVYVTPQFTKRFLGFLRPLNVQVGPHPVFQGTWIDNAAFEIFAPTDEWDGVAPLVITIGHFGTLAFPGTYTGTPQQDKWTSYTHVNRYPGWFSPDGLYRTESTSGPAGFATNWGEGNLGRARSEEIVAIWQQLPTPRPAYFYPISAYIVPPVVHRPAELIQQRSLQLVQAVKHLLRHSNPAYRPLSPVPSQAQVDAATVVFVGGSNGGNQSILPAITRPDLVHGGFSMTFSPSMERAYTEQELGYASGQLSGFANPSATLAPIDQRNWGQYSWNRGLELHDLSLLRRFLRDETYRPFLLYIGDEDITSTGTDWIRAVGTGAYTRSGSRTNANGATLRWMSGEFSGHDTQPVQNPYSGAFPMLLWGDTIYNLIAEALAQRNIPTTPLAHLPRQPGESMRGLDDPAEWYLGRLWTDPPAQPTAPLYHDDNFFADLNPGAAGTALGHQEAMLVHNQNVYVGSAEGVVSRFQVDWNGGGEPLVLRAQSKPLGHQAWGMVVGPGGLYVGTRRHLHRLDLATLQPNLASVELPWEEAKPYHLHLADVLGTYTPQVVYASAQGGLVIHGQNLSRIMEYPEPGITDFEVTAAGGGQISLLSERGLLANLQLNGISGPARVHASSYLQEGAPRDLERANLALGGSQLQELLVALYTGDDWGVTLRVFDPATLYHIFTLPVTMLGASGNGMDLTTVRFTEPNGDLGDHLLLLYKDWLLLYDQWAAMRGNLDLRSVVAAGGGTTAFTKGVNACSVAVGELGGPPSTSGYDEEIVIATESGHLMWLHVDDMLLSLRPGTPQPLPLPANYTMYLGANSNVQPRSNESTPCTWALAEKPGDANILHALDQAGNYWKVHAAGTQPPVPGRKELVTVSAGLTFAAGDNRGWKYVGATDLIVPLQGSSGAPPSWSSPGVPTGVCRFKVKSPEDPLAVPFEQPPISKPVTWSDVETVTFSQSGFFIHPRAGDVLDTTSGRHCFRWENDGRWANLMLGLRVNNGLIDGLWASTANATTQPHPYLNLRNAGAGVAYSEMQAVKLFECDGQVYAALGCPGGRVRVVTPGGYQTTSSGSHGIGAVTPGTPDLGHGGAALAVHASGSGADIYFGVFTHHAPPLNGQQAFLGDPDVLTGAIHKVRFTPGSPGSLNVVQSVELPPNGPGIGARGGFGVIGMCLADVLPDAGNELIVTTIAGDFFVYGAAALNLLYRTWVPGALGNYNSIIVKDCEPTIPGPEIYLASSMGIRRFCRRQ